MVTCHQCGGENRPGARFCSSCGADLSPTRTMSRIGGSGKGASQAGKGTLSGVVHSLKRMVLGAEPAPLSYETVRLPDEDVPPPPQPAGAPASLDPLQPGSTLTHPQDGARRYGIAQARQLDHSIYYDALDLACPACRTVQPGMMGDGLCQHCRASLDVVLIHERLAQHAGGSDAQVDGLVRLGTGQRNILSHRAILWYREHVYTVVEHPGHWGVLVRGRQRRTPDEALAGTSQVARALHYLHERGFAYTEFDALGMESLVVVDGGKGVKLADLSLCIPLPAHDAQAAQAHVERDVTFLARLLFFLATNERLSRSNLDAAPPSLRPTIERVLDNGYADVVQVLADFSRLPTTPAPDRSLKACHGQATHAGQKRSRNEDAVVTFTFDKQQEGQAVPVGFYLVADGMGGHQAGDLASRTVNQVVTDRIIKLKVLPDLQKTARSVTPEHVPAEILSEAIQEANEVVLERGRQDGRDLGSTVTAALVIGNVATVANAGDSRTYLLRGGQMEQITRDHSLVARLLSAGIITPEEVRTHPQRNQIYRCLGRKPEVEVDTFTVQLQAGDRLVLCSDGLWEMVPEGEILHVIERARSPQKACDALIEAANQAGGKDNIAVIVVELE